MSRTDPAPPARLRLLVVDDHALVRAGVRAELTARAPDLEVVAEAEDVEGAVAAVHALRPDVVLLDVHLPGGDGGGGAEVVTACRDAPGTRFLALSISDAADDVVGVIRAGARGYVTKAISTADLAQAVRMKRAPFGSKLAYFEDGTPILLKRKVVMSGEHIVDAAAGNGQQGIAVDVVLDSAGGAQMAQVTRENLKKPMATIYVEYIPVTKNDENGKPVTTVEKRETVVNSATIQSQFADRFQITGITPYSRAQKLAATLRAGSLVAPVYIIEERTIGPNAGKKNIDQGINASLLGLALIIIFMLAYYRKLGLYANIALVVNLILLVALMSLLGATLTLPGIAGIVLTLGMAVDANVLIYERIREEVHEHIEIHQAVRMGFANALSTIVDANITTLIVAVLLFSFGAGPIKGFAVTLSLGILTTMFTAIFVTRALVEYFTLRKANPKINL